MTTVFRPSYQQLDSTNSLELQPASKDSEHNGTDASSHVQATGSPKPNVKALGVPAEKKRLYWMDLLSTTTSLLCLLAAVIVVQNQYAAYHLTYNGQLIVLGFLLAIMNACLLQILPVFFLQMEARFGRSYLQDYQAILRNSWMADDTSLMWRAILLALLLLPIALSAGYKQFNDGSAAISIDPNHADYENRFGLFAPPRTQPLGTFSGLSWTLNATSLLSAASRVGFPTAASWKWSPEEEPTLPDFPASFGLSTLVLNHDSAAILDTPWPNWVEQVQDKMHPGESWNMSAVILGSVVSLDSSIDAHRDESMNSKFWQPYSKFLPDDGQPNWLWTWNDNTTLALLQSTEWPYSDQTWTFLAIENVSTADSDFQSLARYANMYHIERKRCRGTWTITRAGADLVDGDCDDHPEDDNSVPIPDQRVFTNLEPPPMQWSLIICNENLGVFGSRPGSQWLRPMMATTVAAYKWARAALVGPGAAAWPIPDDQSKNSLLYQSQHAVITSQRPAINRHSPWIFVILAINPALSLLTLASRWLLYSVPIGKGFSPIALLAGFERQSLDRLRGASFSGKTMEKVRLAIQVSNEPEMVKTPKVSYSIPLSPAETWLGSIQRKVTYS